MKLFHSLLILFFSLTLQNSFCSEYKHLVTAENATQFLQIQPLEGISVTRTSKTLLKDPIALAQINGILNLAIKSKNLKRELPQDPDKKELIKAGLVGGGLLIGDRILGGTTRGVSDLSTLVPLAIGAAGTATLVYWWIGNEMKLIAGFKPELNKLANQLGQMQKLSAQLKEKTEEQQEQLLKNMEITEELRKALPAVVEASGDNARLSSILSMALQGLKEHEAKIAYLTKKLPEAERSALLDQAQVAIPDEAVRKAKALEEYNSAHLWRNKTNFDQLKDDWLKRHHYDDLREGK